MYSSSIVGLPEKNETLNTVNKAFKRSLGVATVEGKKRQEYWKLGATAYGRSQLGSLWAEGLW